MLVYLLFIIGFVLLIKGADWLVKGASSIAKNLNLSDITIGLTVVSIGTSMPELIVNIIAGIRGVSDIAIGNVLGSNVANILLILGVSALIYPLRVLRGVIRDEIPFSFVVLLIFAAFANSELLQPEGSLLSRGEGIILLIIFVSFLTFVLRKTQDYGISDEVPPGLMPPLKAVALIIVGITALSLGGHWIVEGAIHIAQLFSISERVIGLTIVAIGTSLPELATSAVAAYKKRTDIAVGNVIGSNIFNILWILGVSALVSPLVYNLASNIDIAVVAFSTILLFAVLFVPTKKLIDRWKGVLFLLVYAAYMGFLLFYG